MMVNKYSLTLFLLAFIFTGCTPVEQQIPTPPTLTVMSHDSFAVSEDVVALFESEHNLKVKFLKAGDTGAALNQAILSRSNPLADVFYGIDNTFLSRALNEDIFAVYDTPALVNISVAFQLDPQKRALPVDFGDVCLNYDIAYFSDHKLPPPASLDDLLLPQYNGLLVVENPATSSPGLAFLLATIGVYGDPGYLDYWRSLLANDLLVVNDWETAYYAEFSTHGGTRPLVVSYASSPPAEIIFAETPTTTPPTAAITQANTCFRQVEFVALLKGAPNPELGQKWIDFMLSTPFQEDLPMQMFVFPVNPDAKLPPEFTQYVTIPVQTAQVPPADIDQHREQWIKEWTETVLR
jgi:thiamine transport system substrate-binding protein